MFDLSLYLIADLQYGDVTQVVKQAVQGGVTVVQLRAKHLPPAEYAVLAEKLQTYLSSQQIPLIINDHIKIAQSIDAAGVHLGQNDSSIADARALLGRDKMIGLTVNNLQQAKLAQQMDVDYLGVGPIFPTQTKENPAKTWGLVNAEKFIALNKLPAVAIGGIGLANAAPVSHLGFSGIAVAAAICAAADPQQAAVNLRRCLEASVHVD